MSVGQEVQGARRGTLHDAWPMKAIGEKRHLPRQVNPLQKPQR